MNKRNFLKLIGASTISIPFVSAINPEQSISYTEFDWIPEYKIDAYRLFNKVTTHIGDYSYYSNFEMKTFQCNTSRLLHVTSPLNEDLTSDGFYKPIKNYIENENTYIVFLPYSLPYSENMKIYTNPILLAAAKKMGFTHIYRFIKDTALVPCNFKQNHYFVQGIIAPEWKTEKCKIPIVNV